MGSRKKILILIDWFVPGYKAGGPIQSCINLCFALRESYDIYVLTTDTDHGETTPYTGIIPGRWMFSDSLGVNIFYSKKKGLKASQLARELDLVGADFIYLNHMFSPFFVVYPLWLKYTNHLKGKVIVCPRGALYDSALSLKSYKKKPLLFLYKLVGIHHQITFHATNEREKEVIEKYFPGSEIRVADNLPDANQPVFTSCIKEPGKLNCIFIARIVPIKNLFFVLQILKYIKEQVTLTIVGPIENELYWEDCNKIIAEMPSSISVNYLGPKQKDQLTALMQQHHLFFMPTKGENFGHSIFEAMLNGRPVLISDQTPWLNLEAQNAGWDLPLQKPGKFAYVIKKLAESNQAEFDGYAKGAWQYASHFIHNNTTRKQYFNLFA